MFKNTNSHLTEEENGNPLKKFRIYLFLIHIFYYNFTLNIKRHARRG